jgi:hypothetical protein
MSNLRFSGGESRLGSDGSALGSGSLLGSDGARPGVRQESFLARSRQAQAESRKQAARTAAASSGTIISRNADGTYEVLATDGSTVSGCSSRKRARWLDGQPVMLEWCGGQPQIVSFATMDAPSG